MIVERGSVRGMVHRRDGVEDQAVRAAMESTLRTVTVPGVGATSSATLR